MVHDARATRCGGGATLAASRARTSGRQRDGRGGAALAQTTGVPSTRPETVPRYARAAAIVGAVSALGHLAIGGYLAWALTALYLGGGGDGTDELLGFLAALLLIAPVTVFGLLGWAQLAAAWYTWRGSHGARLGLAITLGVSAVVAAKSRLPAEAIAIAAVVLVSAAAAALIAYRA